ncbi:hypothetical protein D9M73_115800 [compost metagenome]
MGMGVENPIDRQPLPRHIGEDGVGVHRAGGTRFLIEVEHRIDDDAMVRCWIGDDILDARCPRIEPGLDLGHPRVFGIKPADCGGQVEAMLLAERFDLLALHAALADFAKDIEHQRPCTAFAMGQHRPLRAANAKLEGRNIGLGYPGCTRNRYKAVRQPGSVGCGLLGGIAGLVGLLAIGADVDEGAVTVRREGREIRQLGLCAH